MTKVAQPAYRIVEGFSDGVYDFMQSLVISNALPKGLDSELSRTPEKDSYGLFQDHFQKKEIRYLERLAEAYPTRQDVQTGYYNPAQLEAWSARAKEEQLSVVVDSLRDTLAERYRLELFGRQSGNYAKDRRNWDPAVLAMSGIVGGAFAYLNGIHTTAHLADFNLGMDMRAAMRMRQTAAGDALASRAASLELGYKDSPLSLATDWDAGRGGLYGERYVMKYRLRY